MSLIQFHLYLYPVLPFDEGTCSGFQADAHTYDEKIFQSVIIVTDRKVLDEQLQNTVYQFDHVEGVVQKIEKNAQQLKNAINDGSPIIITTLQKFPEIYILYVI